MAVASMVSCNNNICGHYRRDAHIFFQDSLDVYIYPDSTFIYRFYLLGVVKGEWRLHGDTVTFSSPQFCRYPDVAYVDIYQLFLLDYSNYEYVDSLLFDRTLQLPIRLTGHKKFDYFIKRGKKLIPLGLGKTELNNNKYNELIKVSSSLPPKRMIKVPSENLIYKSEE